MGAGRSLLLAAGLGAITGVRSMSGLAALARRLNARPGRRGEALPLRLLRSDAGSTALAALAAGEAVADKLPLIPARTEPLPLGGRAVLGALAGATLGLAERSHGAPSSLPWAMAGIGAAAAVLTAAGATTLRRELGEQGAPDLLLGLLEDGGVLAASAALAGPGDRGRWSLPGF